MSTEPATHWRSSTALLILMSIAMPIAFNTWNALLNNFVVERAAFTGLEIGILHSLREVPGFIAFTTVFVLLLIREQTFAVLSLAMLGLGVAATGFFPTVYGLYFTTIIMSLGFHYFEAIKQSLSLQWLSKDEAPQVLGKLISVASITSLIVYGVLWVLLELFFIKGLIIMISSFVNSIHMGLISGLLPSLITLSIIQKPFQFFLSAHSFSPL